MQAATEKQIVNHIYKGLTIKSGDCILISVLVDNLGDKVLPPPRKEGTTMTQSPAPAASNRGKIYVMSMIAVMTAVTCVLAPLSIPIGEVPISFTNLVIYFTLYLLGWKRASVSYIVYMLIGMVGVPVFSGFAGGLGKLAGPTGGYIIGFLPMAVIAGLVIDHTHNRLLQLLGMILGTAVCYALGTAWFCFSTHTGVMAALWMCVIPFIVGDLVKMALAMTMGPVIRGRLEKSGLLHI